MKATYGEIDTGKIKCYCGHTSTCNCSIQEGSTYEKIIESREIFKDPITDDGTKRSKKGLLQVTNKCTCSETEAINCGSKCKNIYVIDQCTWEEESKGLLTTVFKDSKLVRRTTLQEIRDRLSNI